MEPANTIATRIYDFLKDYPPFTLIPKDRLKALASRIVVQYYEAGQTIFKQGDTPNKFFYVVREGAVQLWQEAKGDVFLIDEYDEGDVFGIRPLIALQPYLSTAKVEEESLIYAIHTDDFRDIMENNPKVAYFLASSFASGKHHAPEINQQKGRLFLQNEQIIESGTALFDVQLIESSKKPITCKSRTSIRNAAVIMSDNEVGSIIVVDEGQRPIGIVTDRDFRKKVVTGRYSLNEVVDTIMSKPVITIEPQITAADAQILMLKHQFHHLVITEDGTAATKVIGVISEHELLVIQGNNPAILVKEIKTGPETRTLRNIRQRAEELLKKYIYQEVSIAFISNIMTEINDAIIVRCIQLSELELAAEGHKKPAAAFCWMALGSEGRQEQLLRTDQDNALAFEDVADPVLYQSTKDYYLSLSKRVTGKLNEVGFDYCPGDMMASNPSWCQSISEWKAQFKEWIYQPNDKALLLATIFFDYRPVYGQLKLTEELTKSIFDGVAKQKIFLSFMAKNALQNPPPLSFFRNFVVERGGEHKDEFDIKKRAMMPLADAARVLMLEAQVGKINNTFKRFEKLAELEPQNAELYNQAADAYEILMRYRTLQGLKNNNTGRYFNPSELTKLERMNLRNSFRPIEELQSLLTLRFQLGFIR